MVSKFGWIDFSETERRQMLDVVQLFSERETRDELGVGTIRDAFSDYFFPGTSTIQTRPKYLLIIPWMYLDFERKKTPSAKIERHARKFETDLIEILLKNGSGSGVIGKDAKKQLVQLPSMIYWTGLKSWGIRLFPGSRKQYHDCLDRFYKQGSLVRNGEADGELSEEKRIPNWHPAIPSPPKNLRHNASLKLNTREAGYLRERLLFSHRDCLLAKLLCASTFHKADFPWQHPIVSDLSAGLSETITQAQNFSEVIHGAALLYNHMLSEAADNSGWADDFKKRLKGWASMIEARYSELSDWYKDIDRFWACPPLDRANITISTKIFISKWLDAVFFFFFPEGILGDHNTEKLIVGRETQLKGLRARLTNRNALNRWRGAAGTSRLIYRWDIATTFVIDILSGLKTEAKGA